ncbi:hypothetical protein [Nonomuraea jabiensis]|uniref:Major facilitator superfamily (MFS) profile domain-containing protein n=1 Tax=Nonomuraea jabiensis TaxID=882448 RepID=A0A7W9LEX2_9ACTN|nr:hypothetical protein [Nonomuraea jabiensis]MBB5781317.1 hypothetical protein [Nonomuraea jabiensis]
MRDQLSPHPGAPRAEPHRDVAGRLISRSGKLKPFIVTGAVLLTAGFAGLGTIDHTTSLVFMGAAMLCVGLGVGLGVGMTLQNFVLVVQNAVPLKDIGAASSTVSFFRSLGGTIGVLGAVLLKPVTLRTSLDQPDVARSA